MTRILTAALTTALLIAAHAGAEDKDKTPARKDKLVGDYTLVSGERNGEKLDSVKTKDVAVTIAANAITTFDKDKKQVYAATYTLDTSRTPWKIRMKATLTPGEKGKGTETEGLIEQEGETVRLIYALPKGKTPTEFKTSEGQQMFVLKKASK